MAELREDKRFYPLLVSLAGCLCDELSASGIDTCFCGVVSGESVDISRVSPEAGGMGWVRLAGITPKIDARTGQSPSSLCGMGLVATIEVGFADCYPIDDEGGPLSLDDELDATRRLQAGTEASFRAVFCCDWVRNKRRLSPGQWAPGGPEGGVMWSTWAVTVEVP